MLWEWQLHQAGQKVGAFLQAVTLQGSSKEQSTREGNTDMAHDSYEKGQCYQTSVINRNVSPPLYLADVCFNLLAGLIENSNPLNPGSLPALSFTELLLMHLGCWVRDGVTSHYFSHPPINYIRHVTHGCLSLVILQFRNNSPPLPAEDLALFLTLSLVWAYHSSSWLSFTIAD